MLAGVTWVQPTMVSIEKDIEDLYQVAENDKANKIGLGAVQKELASTCFSCRKKGHRVNKCRSLAQGSNNKSNSGGKCHNCMRLGHKKQDC